jgi:hypothetical protein
MKATHADVAQRMGLYDRIQQADGKLRFLKSDAYLHRIEGTLGVDPALAQSASANRPAETAIA